LEKERSLSENCDCNLPGKLILFAAELAEFKLLKNIAKELINYISDSIKTFMLVNL
jgi:hypothetical protein